MTLNDLLRRSIAATAEAERYARESLADLDVSRDDAALISVVMPMLASSRANAESALALLDRHRERRAEEAATRRGP